jgi:hypothetical protein
MDEGITLTIRHFRVWAEIIQAVALHKVEDGIFI